MQFTNFLGCAILLPIAIAIPVSETVSSVSTLGKRVNVRVKLCTDDGFAGYCQYINQPVGECVALSSDLNDQVSSVLPDQDAGDCRFFLDYGCSDPTGWRHFDAAYPGMNSLYTQNIGANDAISSFMCFGA